eukprot:1142957-Pelagomonas_calceolata.AAC.6
MGMLGACLQRWNRNSGIERVETAEWKEQQEQDKQHWGMGEAGTVEWEKQQGPEATMMPSIKANRVAATAAALAAAAVATESSCLA